MGEWRVELSIPHLDPSEADRRLCYAVAYASLFIGLPVWRGDGMVIRASRSLSDAQNGLLTTGPLSDVDRQSDSGVQPMSDERELGEGRMARRVRAIYHQSLNKWAVRRAQE